MSRRHRALLAGHCAERGAARYLKRRGLKLLTSNYRTRFGEIDLVMRDRDTIVFVEVRLRTRSDYGDPEDTVDFAKQHRLLRTADHFFDRRHDLAHMPSRFDVVAVTQRNYLRRYRWIKDAFES